MKLSPVKVWLKTKGIEETFNVPQFLAHPSGWTIVHYCPQCYEVWCVTKFPLGEDRKSHATCVQPCADCGGGDLFHFGVMKDWTAYMSQGLLWHQLNVLEREVFGHVEG